MKNSFWTKPRPALFFILIIFAFLNFNYGPGAFYIAGLQYKEKGWTEASRICLLVASWTNPWSVYGKRAEAFNRACLPKHNISQQAQGLNIDAFNLDAAGQTKEAISAFEKLISEYPNFEWPYNNLANIMLEKGDLAQAENLSRKAIAINPDYANAHLTLARILELKGNTEESIQHKQKANNLLEACGLTYN